MRTGDRFQVVRNRTVFKLNLQANDVRTKEVQMETGIDMISTLWIVMGLIAVVIIFGYALILVLSADQSNRRFRYLQIARNWFYRTKSPSAGR